MNIYMYIMMRVGWWIYQRRIIYPRRWRGLNPRRQQQYPERFDPRRSRRPIKGPVPEPRNRLVLSAFFRDFFSEIYISRHQIRLSISTRYRLWERVESNNTCTRLIRSCVCFIFIFLFHSFGKSLEYARTKWLFRTVLIKIHVTNFFFENHAYGRIGFDGRKPTAKKV